MNTSELTEKINMLPEKARKEVEDFVDFLHDKYAGAQGKSKKKASNYGNAAGLIEMAGDFDEPLDEFFQPEIDTRKIKFNREEINKR